MVMRQRLLRAVMLVLIWQMFVLGAVVAMCAPLAALLLVIFRPRLKLTRIENIILAMDRLNAALLGWSGKHTISAECGFDDCRFCAWLCRILHRADTDHCGRAAANEGLKK